MLPFLSQPLLTSRSAFYTDLCPISWVWCASYPTWGYHRTWPYLTTARYIARSCKNMQEFSMILAAFDCTTMGTVSRSEWRLRWYYGTSWRQTYKEREMQLNLLMPDTHEICGFSNLAISQTELFHRLRKQVCNFSEFLQGVLYTNVQTSLLHKHPANPRKVW